MLLGNECQERNIIPIIYKKLFSNNIIQELVKTIDTWINCRDDRYLQENIRILTSGSYIVDSNALGDSLKFILGVLSLVKVAYSHAAFLHCAGYVLMYGYRDCREFLPVIMLVRMLELELCEHEVTVTALNYDYLSKILYCDRDIQKMVQIANHELNNDRKSLDFSPKTSVVSARIIQKEGVPFNSEPNKNYLLKLAISHRQKEVVECLLQGDIDTEDALILAVVRKHYPIIDLLVKSSKVSELEKYSSLFVSVSRGYTDTVKILTISGELRVNVVDVNDVTILKLAVTNGYHQIVKFLISCGAKIRYHDEEEALFYKNIVNDSAVHSVIRKSIATLLWTDGFYKLVDNSMNYAVDFNLALEIHKVSCAVQLGYKDKLCKKQAEIFNNPLVPASFKDQLHDFLFILDQDAGNNHDSCLGLVQDIPQ